MKKQIGFFIWNPFQLFQIQTIAENIPNAELLIVERKNLDIKKIFSNQLLGSIELPIRYITSEYFKTDCPNHQAIICQSPFENMEHCQQTKLIGMQYSMAKERHQYGPWRAMCDLTLVYGQYSDDRISPFSPCVQVGNPRFDPWFSNPDRQQRASDKKTILYLPTWSQTSSINDFDSAINALCNDYKVITKMHHLTEIFETKNRQKLLNSNPENTFGANDDLINLMAEADLILSDYSGAIFDAINLGKPVILLQPNSKSLDETDRFGRESIEYARRNEIGLVVENPAFLRDAVHKTLTGAADFTIKNNQLRTECFAYQNQCGKRAANAISNLLEKGKPRPNHQIYLRDELRQTTMQLNANPKMKQLLNSFNKLKRNLLG